MPHITPNRRDVLRSALALLPGGALDWDLLPRAQAADNRPDQFDAVIVGSGLGGLGCATAFARQGFKALVLEQHDKPGGYATAFRRPGGFVFDVSLHCTSAGERQGVHNLIPGFPEIQDVEFVPHPHLYRAIFPDLDLRVEQKNVPAYIQTLERHFPEEAAGIQALFDDMAGVAAEVMKLSKAGGKPDMRRFPADYPHLFANYNKTWGQTMDAHIKDAKLKAIVSALWAYFGLPPSKLASTYYALPTIELMKEGSYYPRGRSQAMSNAMVKYIEAHGGRVMLGARVEKILTKDGAAYGVKTADKFTPSLSSFIVFLGLKRDLASKTGLHDTEVFYSPDYDPETAYRRLLDADMTNPGFGAMLYDNLYKGYSPAGKNTLTLVTLQGFDHWKKYERDYWAGNKDAYREEKERMANILIRQAEEVLLPGLSKAIEVKEIATPLTNVRYTGNYRGAIYGWDQTLDNSNPRRLSHVTPVRNLYLSGAWTSPGGGYGAVLVSGLECFGEIMARWPHTANVT
jgi:phytoene dehydrogenase-like protein